MGGVSAPMHEGLSSALQHLCKSQLRWHRVTPVLMEGTAEKTDPPAVVLILTVYPLIQSSCCGDPQTQHYSCCCIIIVIFPLL